MPDRSRDVPVSLGDLLLVEADLRPADEEARAAIDALLGFSRTPAAPLTASLGPWQANEPQSPGGVQPPPQRAPSSAQAPETSRQTTPRLNGSRTEVRFVRRIGFDAPDWAGKAEPFQPAAGSDTSLPPPPLFAASHARAILTAMFATFHDGPDFDVDRMVSQLARGRRVEAIPYAQVPTLRGGAQVLIDVAETMDPYRDDITQLLADLDRLFGRAHLEVLQFRHCPSARDDRRRGVFDDPRRRPVRWRPPAPGVPVLIISDFALSPAVNDELDYATAGEWHEFAADVVAAHCHPVGLLPYPPSRWPMALGRVMSFVHWSERTTARQVMRALRETRLATRLTR